MAQFLNIKTLKIICLYIHPPYFLYIFSLYPITEVKKKWQRLFFQKVNFDICFEDFQLKREIHFSELQLKKSLQNPHVSHQKKHLQLLSALALTRWADFFFVLGHRLQVKTWMSAQWFPDLYAIPKFSSCKKPLNSTGVFETEFQTISLLRRTPYHFCLWSCRKKKRPKEMYGQKEVNPHDFILSFFTDSKPFCIYASLNGTEVKNIPALPFIGCLNDPLLLIRLSSCYPFQQTTCAKIQL